ncbi:MAG: hypothetical protein AAGA23_16690 [Pseudomonadota bacterium]
MMYLAGQIVLSLLAAGLLGGIAGWMLRGDLERREPIPVERRHR